MRRSVAAAAIAGSLIVGGATGAFLFGPVLAGAQTSTTQAPDGSSFKSNEDPAHEAAETPEHEAAESSGQLRGHGGHGTNEDPAHEAAETPEHEAAEHAKGGAGGTTTPTTAVTPGTGSATKLSARS